MHHFLSLDGLTRINRVHWLIQELAIGGSKGSARDGRPLGSKFFHFHVVFGKKLTAVNFLMLCKILRCQHEQHWQLCEKLDCKLLAKLHKERMREGNTEKYALCAYDKHCKHSRYCVWTPNWWVWLMCMWGTESGNDKCPNVWNQQEWICTMNWKVWLHVRKRDEFAYDKNLATHAFYTNLRQYLGIKVPHQP